jgi:tetratricopeptide (TPR) repeat protein
VVYFRAKLDSLLNIREYRSAEELITQFAGELSLKEWGLWFSITNAELGNVETAKRVFFQLLAMYTEPSTDRAWALNACAWYDLIEGSCEHLSEADQFSAEAYSLEPWDVAVQSTRGWALLELGEIEQALPLLRRSLRGAVYEHERALILCAIAIAERRRGRHVRAAELLCKARKLDGKCVVLDRAEQELSATVTAS